MLLLYKLYIESYQQVSHTLLFLIIALISTAIYFIAFVRLNVAWNEFDYSETTILSIFGVSFFVTPILIKIIPIFRHNNISTFMRNLDNNIFLNILIAMIIASVVCFFAGFFIAEGWYDKQNHAMTENNLSLIKIISFSALAFFTLIIYMKTFTANDDLKNIIAIVVALIVVIAVNFIFRQTTKPKTAT